MENHLEGYKNLPPPPKLRPRPGLKPNHEEAGIEIPTPTKKVDEGKTSRLLTKSECKGSRGGRKKNADSPGSLIHSIPKFSQVMPKDGKISEVQKVLQSRLLSKQKLRSEQNQERIEQKRPSSLQALIQNLHHQKMSTAGSITSSSSTGSTNQLDAMRKKSRKPSKQAICHVIHEPKKEPEVSADAKVAPELTITATPSKTLSATGRQPKVPTILTPDEYEKKGLPSGYIYWPNANIFVHTTVVFSSLMNGPSVDRHLVPSQPSQPSQADLQR